MPTRQEAQRRHQLKTQRNNFNNHVQTFKHQRKKIEETNIFNPNPYVVDREGLRPVVVDGSNIAKG